MLEKGFRTTDEKNIERKSALPKRFANGALFRSEADFWAEDDKWPIGKTKKELEGSKDKEGMFEVAKEEAVILGLTLSGKFGGPEFSSESVHHVVLSNGDITNVMYCDTAGDWSVVYGYSLNFIPHFSSLKEALIWLEKQRKQGFEKARQEVKKLGLTLKEEHDDIPLPNTILRVLKDGTVMNCSYSDYYGHWFVMNSKTSAKAFNSLIEALASLDGAQNI